MIFATGLSARLAIKRPTSAVTNRTAGTAVKRIILRFFNAAGADPDGDIGESHFPETHLIPIILQSIFEGNKVQVNGTDYDTKDGTCIRDYVHVTDLANGHYLALRYLEDGGGSQECNLGLGKGYSVKEVILSSTTLVISICCSFHKTLPSSCSLGYEYKDIFFNIL